MGQGLAMQAQQHPEGASRGGTAFARPHTILWKVGVPQPKSFRVSPELMLKTGTSRCTRKSSSLSSMAPAHAASPMFQIRQACTRRRAQSRGPAARTGGYLASVAVCSMLDNRAGWACRLRRTHDKSVAVHRPQVLHPVHHKVAIVKIGPSDQHHPVLRNPGHHVPAEEGAGRQGPDGLVGCQRQ